MGDRTTFQLHVYHCPEKERAAALAVIEYHELGPEYEGEDTPGALNMTALYFAAEAPINFSLKVAADLIKAAPGISLVAWGDPAYSEPGAFVAYTPELGRFEADCRTGGEPTWTGEEVAAFFAEADRTARATKGGSRLQRTQRELDRLMGKPWLDDWASCRADITRAS